MGSRVPRGSCALFLTLAACGGGGALPATDDESIAKPGSGDERMTFGADAHTPGFFRDLYRMLSAQAVVDDAEVVERLLVELPHRLDSPGGLPPLSASERATLDGLLVLSVRAAQATGGTPGVARLIADRLIGAVLGLDPARRAWNGEHPEARVAETSAGPATIAAGAQQALGFIVGDRALTCSATAAVARWSPGPADEVWVAESCSPDTYIDGYCEADLWVPGACDDVWVPEDCSGGRWEDEGYYQYRCYGADDCRYVWVPRWVYHDGGCDGGYYEEDCTSGYWEEGLCYGGYWIDGYCVPGHYEAAYPSGTWSYELASAPAACSSLRPAQYAVALSGIEVLVGLFADELDPEWDAAALAVLATAGATTPSEAGLAALLEILEAVAE
jgi:hypothetical protein